MQRATAPRASPDPARTAATQIFCPHSGLFSSCHLTAKLNSHGSSFWGWLFLVLCHCRGGAAAPGARPRCSCAPAHPIYLPRVLQRHLQSPSPAAPRAQSCSPGHQIGLLLSDIPWSLSLGRNLGEIQNPTLEIQP